LRNKVTVINNQNHIVAHKGHRPHQARRILSASAAVTSDQGEGFQFGHEHVHLLESDKALAFRRYPSVADSLREGIYSHAAKYSLLSQLRK
jgi:hypothetical protein